MSKITANYMAMWTNIFKFSGRSRRSEYWYAVLGQFIVSVLILIVMAFVNGIFNAIGLDMSGLLSVIYTLYYIASTIAFVSLGVRRLHDIGITGLLYLIYLTGIGSIALLIMHCMDSQPGINKYGANPKDRY